MKKRRVTTEELKSMNSVAVLWHHWSSSWFIAMLSLRHDAVLFFDSPLTQDIVCSGSSLEEMLLKAQVILPKQKLYAVTYDGEEFSAPCGYDIECEGVVVDEIKL